MKSCQFGLLTFQKIAIRNMDGFLLKKQFPATYEAFVFDAITLAEETLLAIDTNLDPAILSQFDKEGKSVEIVGLNEKNQIIDILWSSRKTSGVIPFDERIDRKRTKLKRSWDDGMANEANWLLSNGSNITIKDSKSNPCLPFLDNILLGNRIKRVSAREHFQMG